MIHYMKLAPGPFSLMETGLKTIELRLYDKKRQAIKIGDRIRFSCTVGEGEIVAKVLKMHLFENFAQLYDALPLDKCGYLPDDCMLASPADMDIYYAPELQKQLGVVGIELEIIDVKTG